MPSGQLPPPQSLSVKGVWSSPWPQVPEEEGTMVSQRVGHRRSTRIGTKAPLSTASGHGAHRSTTDQRMRSSHKLKQKWPRWIHAERVRTTARALLAVIACPPLGAHIGHVQRLAGVCLAAHSLRAGEAHVSGEKRRRAARGGRTGTSEWGRSPGRAWLASLAVETAPAAVARVSLIARQASALLMWLLGIRGRGGARRMRRTSETPI